MAIDNDTDRVEVPATHCPITLQQLHGLQAVVDPLSDCENLGISLYVTAREFVGACLYNSQRS